MVPTNKKGFTILELLVVIAIIGLLSSMTTYYVNFARIRARDAKRKHDLNQIKLALELFYDEYGHYPRSSIPDEFFWATYNWPVDGFRNSAPAPQSWIRDMPCASNNVGCCDVTIEGGAQYHLCTVDKYPYDITKGGFRDFISPMPIDPINIGSFSPFCPDCITYAYLSDPLGRDYTLIATLENPNDPETCYYQCNKFLINPLHSDHCWCDCETGECAGNLITYGGTTFNRPTLYVAH